MRKVKKQTAHEGGRNAPVSRLLLCVRLFLDMTENVRQRVRCRRIAGTDEPGVNVRGGTGPVSYTHLIHLNPKQAVRSPTLSTLLA